MVGSTPERLWALSDAEVTQSFALLGTQRGHVDAHLVDVLAEAKRRGLGSGDGWGPVDWARGQAPQLPTRTLSDLDTVATAAADTAAGDMRLGAVIDAVTEAARCASKDGADEADPTDPAEGIGSDGPDTEHVGTGGLDLGKAGQIVRFHRSMRGLADPDHLAELTTITLRAARGPHALSERALATALRHAADQLRPDQLVEHDADTRRAHRSLVKGSGPLGLSRYTLLLDDEGAAILDTAVDALAKPSPDPGTGERDPRTPAARRADALIDLVTRAATAPDGLPRQAKTQLVVTTDLTTLTRQARGAGRTLGGDLLTTDTVRRLACDADLIPVVLGSQGEILDQGQTVRLFTPAQTRHLWLRDHGCTFPGCSRPPQWADAHHLVHWADGGPTDLTNAALLCRAHHTVVHRQRYAGMVVATRHGPTVQWDLVPGAYDDRLEALRRADAVPRWPDPRDPDDCELHDHEPDDPHPDDACRESGDFRW
jgi:hypothetical protein